MVCITPPFYCRVQLVVRLHLFFLPIRAYFAPFAHRMRSERFVQPHTVRYTQEVISVDTLRRELHALIDAVRDPMLLHKIYNAVNAIIARKG